MVFSQIADCTALYNRLHPAALEASEPSRVPALPPRSLASSAAESEPASLRGSTHAPRGLTAVQQGASGLAALASLCGESTRQSIAVHEATPSQGAKVGERRLTGRGDARASLADARLLSTMLESEAR